MSEFPKHMEVCKFLHQIELCWDGCLKPQDVVAWRLQQCCLCHLLACCGNWEQQGDCGRYKTGSLCTRSGTGWKKRCYSLKRVSKWQKDILKANVLWGILACRKTRVVHTQWCTVKWMSLTWVLCMERRSEVSWLSTRSWASTYEGGLSLSEWKLCDWL